MPGKKRIPAEQLKKRWVRDHSSKGQAFIQQDRAPRSRLIEGFELREDGTYVDIGSGPTDSLQEAEGTWSADADGMLSLSGTKMSPKKKTLHFDGVAEQFIAAEDAPTPSKIVMFDLGKTLESGDELLTGALDTLNGIRALADASSGPVEIVLISDWEDSPSEPDELEASKQKYYTLLETIGIRDFFEPVEKRVTVSTEVGVFKPDPTFFRASIDKISPGEAFENAIFITEDQGHVLAARDLGLQAVHFKGPGQQNGDIDELTEFIPIVEAFLGG